MRPWQEIIPERDREVYDHGGFGTSQAPGRKAALLIIDVVESFTGSKPADVLESQNEYKTSCGAVAWEALPKIKTLLDACRAVGVPVVYTKGDPIYKDWCRGSTKGWSLGDGKKLHDTPIPAIIAPRSDEFVLRKTKASAFFLTPLTIYLNQQDVDTLIICGTSTSGCIRASVVDAFSHGYRTFVVEQGCFDRSEFSHLVNLYEMNNKYADVIQLEDALAMVEGYAAVSR